MNAALFRQLEMLIQTGEGPVFCQSITDPGKMSLSWKGKHLGEPVGAPCFSCRFAAPLELVICGGGHVAQALAPVALTAGFQVTVLENRPELLSEDSFPAAVEQQKGNICTLLDQWRHDKRTFYAIMTHSHEENRRCLKKILRMPHSYVGMLGSRKQAEPLRRELLEAGFSPAELGEIHHPIGLSIGAETPEEIAVAVTAELIQCRAGLEIGVPLEKKLLEALCDPPYAWVLLTAARGMTPRKPGACMLVRPNGGIVGTIGGGEREAAAIRHGLEVLKIGKGNTFTYPETNGASSCGGSVTYTIVPVREEDEERC